MKQNFDEIINSRLDELFNGSIPQEVIERVEEEKDYFIKSDLIKYLEISSNIIRNMKEMLGDTNCCHSRGAIGGSFILYLLGINDINPLPRRKYNNKLFDHVEDGYNISFEIFKNSFERHNHVIELSYYKPSFTMNFSGYQLKFIYNKIKDLLFRYDYLIPRIYDCSILPYDKFTLDVNYMKNIVDEKTLSLIRRYNVVKFEELVKVIGVSWGEKVIEANEKIGRTSLNEMITTIDDLYELLRNKLGDDLAISICNLANNKNDYCSEVTDILNKYNIDKQLITFIKEFKYLTTKSHVISDVKKLVKLVKIKSDSPEMNEWVHI